ncbi:hypothetical protein K438DRAFT_913584 [Mycena galopus ATCC 62051]|nr:hypothetical protein K438DRAFT_913584 [Mycena galopus ATCC 62051]
MDDQILNPDGTPKRPMNAFMIFARRRRPQISAENQSMRTGDISKILSQEWKTMLPSDKAFYLARAKQLKEAFNTKYPDYVYRRLPNNTRKHRLAPPSSSSYSYSRADTDDATEEGSPDAETPLPLPDSHLHSSRYTPQSAPPYDSRGGAYDSSSYGSLMFGGSYGGYPSHSSSSHHSGHVHTSSYPYPPSSSSGPTDHYRYRTPSADLLNTAYYPPYDANVAPNGSPSLGLRKAHSIPASLGLPTPSGAHYQHSNSASSSGSSSSYYGASHSHSHSHSPYSSTTTPASTSTHSVSSSGSLRGDKQFYLTQAKQQKETFSTTSFLAQGSMSQNRICVCSAGPCHCDQDLNRPYAEFQQAQEGGEISSLLQSVVVPALLAGDCFGDGENSGEMKPGTFFIYYPFHQGPSPLPHGSFTQNDLACVEANAGIEEVSVSIYEPADVVLWIEDNWDHPLIISIQNSGWGGPFAWMLSHQEPSLAIFGPCEDPMMLNVAQSLADFAGFPVVIRPASDNPALTLLAHDNEFQDGNVQFNPSDGNNQETDGSGDLNDHDPPEGRGTSREPSDRRGRDNNINDAEDTKDNSHTRAQREFNPNGATQAPEGGDGGGDGEPSETDGKWEGPLHRTRVKLQLKLDTANSYAVAIGCTTKFTINCETEIPIDLDDLTRPLSQPEVIALLDFEIETRPRETQVDRSYANFGFVAHREQSIIQRTL